MKTFELQIVTADGEKFSGPAQSVLVRAIDGDVEILANHIDYLTALGVGRARVTAGDKPRDAVCVGGMLAITRGVVRVVAATFEWADEIDRARAEQAYARGKAALDAASDESERRQARARMKRAEARIAVCESRN